MKKTLIRNDIQQIEVLHAQKNNEKDIVGVAITLSQGDLDLVITDVPGSLITISHFENAGLNIEDYQIIVVKQGYLFDDHRLRADLAILALTPGATPHIHWQKPSTTLLEHLLVSLV